MTDALDTLFALTEQMIKEGVSLIPRVVPADALFTAHTSYPAGDCISPTSQSRWFYHAHRPEEREPGEHGHFHLFLPHSLFKGVPPLHRPEMKRKKNGRFPSAVVHIAALAFETSGMPSSWFTTNYWVTHEFLMPASAIAERLDRYDMRDAPGDPLVNAWLTAAVAAFRATIIDLLHERDRVLAASTHPNGPYRDKSIEITSRAEFDL